jgi:D-methionine transport system substrate-binding protein
MKSITKKLFVAAAISALCLFAAGCGSSSNNTASQEKKDIKIGVTAGPHAEVMDEVKKEAAKQGINLQVVEFNDYVQPNTALANKDLDMNSMQHQPYLDNVVKKQGLKLSPIGKTIILPMAVYSHKFKSINDITDGSTVAIPNDPTNGARALLLLQQAKLITLKTGTSVDTAVTDISENPKNLKFVELDAAQISRSLDDTDLACVNTNYAIPAGLNPQKDSLLVEDKDSPYANVMVVRTEDKDNASYKKVMEIYQSEPIKKFILEHFQGTILPAF